MQVAFRTIGIVGAAGRMGTRVRTRLAQQPEFELLLVDVGKGAEQLQREGLHVVSGVEAAQRSDVLVLAVPDNKIAAVAQELVPYVRSGCAVLYLDPAVPFAGVLPQRPDVTYFVVHPSHPPLFQYEETPEARRDHGGGIAPQSIVCTLLQGPEEHYQPCEQLAKEIFAPIRAAYRLNIHQMALLEPILSEAIAYTLLSVLRDAYHEAVARGIPEPAVRDFLLGHIRVELAILFGEIQWRPSDAAERVRMWTYPRLLNENWRRLFDDDQLHECVQIILES